MPAYELKFEFGETLRERELLDMNKLRDNVFRHYLGHLRLKEDFGGQEKFTFKADHHFVYATTKTPITIGDKKQNRPVIHFGRIRSVKKDRIVLDTPSTITTQGIDEAKLYTFAIPVFPRGEIDSIKGDLEKSGISCESLCEWLSSASEMIQEASSMEVYVPIPKVAIICSKFLELDANNQPVVAQHTTFGEELFELGYLLSHSAYIIVFDKGRSSGKSMLYSYLKLNWKDWFEKWIDVKRARHRVTFEDADSIDQLIKRLAIPLSFSTLKSMWEYERKDIELVV